MAGLQSPAWSQTHLTISVTVSKKIIIINEITKVHVCDSSTSLLILSLVVCFHPILAWVQDGVAITRAW